MCDIAKKLISQNEILAVVGLELAMFTCQFKKNLIILLVKRSVQTTTTEKQCQKKDLSKSEEILSLIHI